MATRRARVASAAAIAALAACAAPVTNAPDVGVANSTPPRDSIEARERGAYVARAANCVSCHTADGGEPFSGGRSFTTPFCTFYSANLTPDPETGIGAWSEEEFATAVRRGVRPDGALLYPVMPTESYAHMTDADVRALRAYLRSVRPAKNAVPDHRLSPPLNVRASLGVWRALFFEPATHAARPDRGPSWNRGAYLVEALGHCGACRFPPQSSGSDRVALPVHRRHGRGFGTRPTSAVGRPPPSPIGARTGSPFTCARVRLKVSSPADRWPRRPATASRI